MGDKVNVPTQSQLVEVTVQRLCSTFEALSAEGVVDRASETSQNTIFLRDPTEKAEYKAFWDGFLGPSESIAYGVVVQNIIQKIANGESVKIVKDYGSAVLLLPLADAENFKSKVALVALEIELSPQVVIQIPGGDLYSNNFQAHDGTSKSTRIRNAVNFDFGHCNLR